MNRGYGGNQKTCYRLALAAGADIVIMIHPDYQYTPQLIPAMASLVASGLYPCMLASRILGGRRASRWHAGLEVHRQPFSDLGREHFAGRKALRIPHRLPCLFPRLARAFASRKKLGRLRFRQPNPGTGALVGLRHRGSHLSGKVYARSFLDKFSQKRSLRLRLSSSRPSNIAGPRIRGQWAIVSRGASQTA